MASDLHDPLGRALDDLRGDVAHAPLASPADIRARGERRARRQRVVLGAGTVVAVAAIAITGAVLPGAFGPDAARHPLPPAGDTPSVTTSPSPTSGTQTPSSPATVAGARPLIDVTPVGSGEVPAAYFLPGRLWTGPDFAHGAKIRSIEPREFEGSVGRFMCDPDGEPVGDVKFVQAVRADGTVAGTQKVRLLASPGAAMGYVVDMTSALPLCQGKLQWQANQAAGDLAPGETAPTPTAEVTEDTAARVEDSTGSIYLYKTVTDYGTGAGSRLVEWVALIREGSAASFISLNQFQEGDVSFGALKRIAAEARQQMAWAATQK